MDRLGKVSARKAAGGICVLLAALAVVAMCATHRRPDSTIAAYTVAARGTDHGLQAESAWPTGSVDVNTADLKTLETLRNVGPKLAQAILDERTANGSFDYPEDLLAVKGIGSKKLAGFYSQLLFPARVGAP